MNRTHKPIYLKTKERNLAFRHVSEVGVYLPETSNSQLLYYFVL